jgi:hypothetical protein
MTKLTSHGKPTSTGWFMGIKPSKRVDITGYIYIYIYIYTYKHTYGQLGDMGLFENGGLTVKLRPSWRLMINQRIRFGTYPISDNLT